MALPFQFRTQGAAMTAAMNMIGSSRKRYLISEISNRRGFRRWIVTDPDGNPVIFFEGTQA